MALRITDPVKDLPRLNRELRLLQRDNKEFFQLKQRVQALVKQTEDLQSKRELTSTNAMDFQWDGPNLKITWAAGYIKDREGELHHVPAGEKTGLTANIYYWMGWNPVHQTMSVVSAPETLTGIKNILVICRVYTGTNIQTGDVGGGGTETNTTQGASGKEYKAF